MITIVHLTFRYWIETTKKGHKKCVRFEFVIVTNVAYLYQFLFLSWQIQWDLLDFQTQRVTVNPKLLGCRWGQPWLTHKVAVEWRCHVARSRCIRHGQHSPGAGAVVESWRLWGSCTLGAKRRGGMLLGKGAGHPISHQPIWWRPAAPRCRPCLHLYSTLNDTTDCCQSTG